MAKNAIINRLEYYPFRAFLALLKLLPYRFSKAIIVTLFIWIGYGLGIRKEVAKKQLQTVYPDWDEKRLKAVLKEIYRQMALNIVDEYLVSDEKLKAKSSLVGAEHMYKAIEMGKGVILATAHFGNWEAARILPDFDIPLSVITKKQRNTLFDDYTNSIRERRGVHIIDMKRGLKGMMEELKDGRVVAILADQNAGKKGLMLDFLGYPASHWKGVAKLSLRYQIPIVPGFVLRKKDGSLEFRFSKMIYLPDEKDSEENYIELLGIINKEIEAYINEFPQQWFWVHRRWKYGYDMFQR